MMRVLFGAIKKFRTVGKSYQFFEWVSKNKNLMLLLGLSKCHKIFWTKSTTTIASHLSQYEGMTKWLIRKNYLEKVQLQPSTLHILEYRDISIRVLLWHNLSYQPIYIFFSHQTGLSALIAPHWPNTGAQKDRSQIVCDT